MDLSQLQVSQETINQVKALLSGPGTPYMPEGIRKDITQATGLVAYNLEPVAKLLVPAITPIRNAMPRVANTRGGTAANWKVINSLDIAKAAIFTAEGTKASTVSYTVSDKAGSFKTMSAGDNVSMQAQWAGKTFEDVKAKAVVRLLTHVLIREEQGLLGGRVSALGAVTAPTLATVASGGTVADATYNVFVRALVPLPGTGLTAVGRFSTATSTGALSNSNASILTGSTPAVVGATRYEWYIGTAGAEKLEATTTINSFRLTALAGTGVTKAAVAAADTGNGAVTSAWDGILAQLDGTANLATSLATGTNGTGTSLALSDIDSLLQNMWDTYRVDPDVIYVNSQQSKKITDLVLAASGAPTLYVTSGAEKAAITGGYRVTHYINKITGKPIPIVTHPYLDPGTVLIGTYAMPFPASDIDNPVEIETRMDYLQIDYPVTSPKWEFEVLVDQVLKLFFPGSWAVIRNVAAA